MFASSTGTVLRVHNLRERSFRPLLKRLGWAKQGFGLHSFLRSYVSALIVAYMVHDRTTGDSNRAAVA